MLELKWRTCGNDEHWCDFFNLKLDKNLGGVEGVYVIFYLGEDQPGRVVRVGQGHVEDRIATHREDSDVTQYCNKGLLVTWAKVSAANRDGVEAYLANLFDPLVGDRFPENREIEVNSPFD